MQRGWGGGQACIKRERNGDRRRGGEEEDGKCERGNKTKEE